MWNFRTYSIQLQPYPGRIASALVASRGMVKAPAHKINLYNSNFHKNTRFPLWGTGGGIKKVRPIRQNEGAMHCTAVHSMALKD